MCVTCAIKLPRDRDTGKPTKDAKWVLFKIRDRAYEPTYQFKTYNDGVSTTLFLIDEDSDWTECLRVNNESEKTEIMFVNSALNNSMDKKDGIRESFSISESVKYAPHGKVARKVARTETIEDALKYFKDNKFDGCTFVSDGEVCYLIESSLPSDVKRHLMKKEGRKSKQGAKADDYVTTTEEIKDWICVRTNHGITNEKAGYQEYDGISYQSSENRRDFAEAYIRSNVFTISDIIPAIDAMGEPTVNKNPFLRPRRIKKEIEEWIEKGNKAVNIYSTSAFVLTSGGNIHLKLYDAQISKINIQKIFSKDFPIKVSIIR